MTSSPPKPESEFARVRIAPAALNVAAPLSPRMTLLPPAVVIVSLATPPNRMSSLVPEVIVSLPPTDGDTLLAKKGSDLNLFLTGDLK